MKRILLFAYGLSSLLACLSWVAGLGEYNVRTAGVWVTEHIPKGSLICSNRLPSSDFPPFRYLDYRLQYAMEGRWLILLSEGELPPAPKGYRLMFWRDRPWYSYINWPFPCRYFAAITQEHEVSIWKKT